MCENYAKTLVTVIMKHPIGKNVITKTIKNNKQRNRKFTVNVLRRIAEQAPCPCVDDVVVLTELQTASRLCPPIKNSLDDTIGAISRAWRATSEARRSFPTGWLVQRDAVADFKRRYWYLSADGSDRSAPGRLPMAAPISPDSSPSAPCLDGF